MSYRKKYIEKFVWKTSLFRPPPSFLVIFCCFLRLLPPISQVMYLLNGPLHNVIMGIMLCEDIMSERFFSISSFFSNYFSAFRYFVYRIKTHEIFQTVLTSTVRLWLRLCVRFLTRSQFQKVCLLHDGTFHPIHLLQTLSILFYHFACVIH